MRQTEHAIINAWCVLGKAYGLVAWRVIDAYLASRLTVPPETGQGRDAWDEARPSAYRWM
ncbi:hypothetical protein BDV95DRAFT_587893 [Massariosphaeria phaeospora]|uniref:Uncharacterized protein n=1 Tax=Massariosphaeria phaeospora TaxID=100035 RepID=A0A7C8HYI1_9PLEO|nr:hypothetical protein BDV95DRAFT_587893 [Massariosphaeria phaeospora]